MLAKTQKSLVRFVIIGGLTFGIDYSLTLFLHYVVGLPGFLASALSFSCAFIFNFLMSAKWVFKQRKTKARRFSTKSQMTLFMLLTIINLGVSTGFVAMASTWGIEVMISKIVITAAIAAWNFVINQNFIFAEKN